MKNPLFPVLVLVAVAGMAALAPAASAKPAYCNCQDCATASPWARCTLEWNGQVVYCDDYEYYYCFANASSAVSLQQPVETARKDDKIDPSESQSCFIQLTCPAGDVISCSNANNQCSSGDYYVECGGTRIDCPPCSAQTECKYGKPPVWCSSQVGDCHVDYLFGVYCDGVYYPCGQTPPQ